MNGFLSFVTYIPADINLGPDLHSERQIIADADEGIVHRNFGLGLIDILNLYNQFSSQLRIAKSLGFDTPALSMPITGHYHTKTES